MSGRPLTIEEVMAILPETVPRVAALTETLTPAQLHTCPAVGSWSVNDVLAHLRACHDVLGGNVLRIVAEDTPTWKGMKMIGETYDRSALYYADWMAGHERAHLKSLPRIIAAVQGKT